MAQRVRARAPYRVGLAGTRATRGGSSAPPPLPFPQPPPPLGRSAWSSLDGFPRAVCPPARRCRGRHGPAQLFGGPSQRAARGTGQQVWTCCCWVRGLGFLHSHVGRGSQGWLERVSGKGGGRGGGKCGGRRGTASLATRPRPPVGPDRAVLVVGRQVLGRVSERPHPPAKGANQSPALRERALKSAKCGRWVQVTSLPAYSPHLPVGRASRTGARGVPPRVAFPGHRYGRGPKGVIPPRDMVCLPVRNTIHAQHAGARQSGPLHPPTAMVVNLTTRLWRLCPPQVQAAFEVVCARVTV